MARHNDWGEHYFVCDWCEADGRKQYVDDGYGEFDLCEKCANVFNKQYDLQSMCGELKALGCDVQVVVSYKGYILKTDESEDTE
jgi:hypothetical protein